MPTAPMSTPTRRLTGVALWLLDVPFEPASATTGELFDRMLEHVCVEVTRTATAIDAGGTPEPQVLQLPFVEPARRRRDQILLRRNVLAGRHPAEPSSLREAETRLRQALTDMTRMRRHLPDGLAHNIAIASALLSGLVRAVEIYRRSAIRLHLNIVAVQPDLRRQASLAARAERDLIRRIRQTADVTYGLREFSELV